MARRPRVSPPGADVGDAVSPPAPATTISIRLLRPHGFVDTAGRRHHWNAGYTARGDEAEMLVARGAVHAVSEEGER